MSARHPYGGSPSSTNPFDKVKVKEDLFGKDGQKGQNRQEKAKEKDRDGQNSIKS